MIIFRMKGRLKWYNILLDNFDSKFTQPRSQPFHFTAPWSLPKHSDLYQFVVTNFDCCILATVDATALWSPLSSDRWLEKCLFDRYQHCSERERGYLVYLAWTKIPCLASDWGLRITQSVLRWRYYLPKKASDNALWSALQLFLRQLDLSSAGESLFAWHQLWA